MFDAYMMYLFHLKNKRKPSIKKKKVLKYHFEMTSLSDFHTAFS